MTVPPWALKFDLKLTPSNYNKMMLKALGNAVVPQVSEVLGRAILTLDRSIKETYALRVGGMNGPEK